jgi:hypothetical protein
MNKYVTVLDFELGEVFIYQYDVKKVIDIEEFIREQGHDHSSLEYMCTDELKLTIK